MPVIQGTLVNTDGTMQVILLDDATEVPGTAHIIEGIAHAANGARYVAPLPVAPDLEADPYLATQSIAGQLVRADGAQIILATTAGTDHWTAGFRYSNLNELIAAETPSTHLVGGFGCTASGVASITITP